MKIFIDELQKRHRANVVRLFKRHKAGVGYLILCIGTIIALAGVQTALNEASEQRDQLQHQQRLIVAANLAAKAKGEENRAIICENITRADRQTLINLHTKVDQELIKSLHLTQKQVNESVHKQLLLSSEQREALQPSNPASACSSNITTLQKGKPPTIREHLLKAKRQAAQRSTPARKAAPRAPVVVAPRHARPAPRTTRPHNRATTRPPTPSPQRPVTQPRPPAPAGVTTPTILPAAPARNPEPPLVRVPPVKAGPLTTPEVTVTATVPKV